MAEDDLQVIANKSPKTFLQCHSTPHCQIPSFQYDLLERDFRCLVQGFNRLAVVIGRARNPQQLGDLDVVQMDFKPVGGKETKLLILHVPPSVSNIIRKEFAGVAGLLVTVQKPLLEGEVLVAAAPYYVKPAALKPCGARELATAHATEPLLEYVEVAKCHLHLGNSERALKIAEAAINSCGGNLEAYLVKGHAASDLKLYKVGMESYEEALGLTTEGSAEHADVSQRVGKAKALQEQALNGKFDEATEGGEVADYVSEWIEIQTLNRGPGYVKHTTGVFAKKAIGAGELVVASNGIDEGFATILDACGKSSRLREQVELLWFYKLHDTSYLNDEVIPDVVSSFRPPRFFDCNDDIVMDIAKVWCPTFRARMKGNDSSLWLFPCFFHEVAEDRHNVDIQVKGRTVFIRARRDIEAGKELTLPAKEAVVQTRFWCQGGALVREQIVNGGECIDYFAWGLRGEDPPADTDWNSFIRGPTINDYCTIPYRKEELDTSSTDEVVAWLVERCNELRPCTHNYLSFCRF